MALTQLAPPYPIFTDKSGSPLDNGYLYFGEVNKNPETNPIQVYYDSAFTQPAAQPIRTINGYPSRNGSPAAVYTNDYFSVTVRNKRNELVIYSPSGYGITPGTSASFTDQMTYNEGSVGAVDRTLTSRLQDYVSVKDFGAVGDGVTDDTAAIQAALDTGLPIVMPFADYLVTDTLTISTTLGCEIVGQARTVGNATAHPRIIFEPATKRDLFTWGGTPATYVFAGVRISGIAVNGSGPGAAAVFNLPKLYKGNIEAYIFAGIDHFAIVEQWLDCNVSGNINGFRSSAFRITNSTLTGGNITTRTDFDVYISGGDPAYTTYGYDIETFSIISGRITNMIESVDCAIRMARGNTIDSSMYTENIPRTNTGALLEIGKIDAGTPDGTTVFRHSGSNLHGLNGLEPAYVNTVLADIDHCSAFSISGTDIKRFGSLVQTTANSNSVVFENSYVIGVPSLEGASGVNDFTKLSFSNFRAIGMVNNSFSVSPDQVPTTSGLSPFQPGVSPPRWAYDQKYSTTSQSFWLSVGDAVDDWRLLAPRVYLGSAVISPGTIAAGASYQANVTVTGALGGDWAVASWGALYSGIAISARVTATDTVTVTLTNVTGSPIATIASTLRVMVTKVML